MAKQALNNIDSKKRERIFRTAASEFARHGYHKANINSIAQRAGIAKGSIYLYFTDKLDLYCSTFREAARLQNGIFEEIEGMDLDPITKIEKVLEKSLELFPRYRDMYKMYFDLTTSGNDEFLADIAQVLEKSSAEFFARVLMQGIAAGILRKDLAIKHAAYVIDCVYSTFLATLASRYQKERFRVFTNRDIAKSGNIVEDHFREILRILQVGILAERRGKRTGRRRSPSPSK